MSLTSIATRTITDPSGVPVVGAVIVARLRPVAAAVRVDDLTAISGEVRTTTNASGVYSLTLERNGNITPANTYWEIEERIPRLNGGTKMWAVVAPATATFNPATTGIAFAPESFGETPLSVEAADLRYILSGGVGRVFGAGLYYFTDQLIGPTTAQILDIKNTIVLMPFTVGVTTTFDIAGIYLSATQANTNVRVGIFRTTAGKPSTLVAETGSIATNGTTGLKTATVNVSLTPGLYWLGVVWQGSGGTAPSLLVSSLASATYTHNKYLGVDSSGVATVTTEKYWAYAGVSGALTDLVAGSLSYGSQVSVPVGVLRAA